MPDRLRQLVEGLFLGALLTLANLTDTLAVKVALAAVAGLCAVALLIDLGRTRRRRLALEEGDEAAQDANLYRRAADPAELQRLHDRAAEGAHREWREALGDRLQEGGKELRGLREQPQLAAARGPDVEAWIARTRDTLSTRPDLLALFDHAILVGPFIPDHPRINREAILGEGPARQRLETILVNGTDCLRDFLREDR